MNRSSEPENKLFQWLENNWNKPAQSVAALAAAIFSYWQPPEGDIALGSAGTLLKLTRVFVIPVVWLLMSVPARLYAKRSGALAWAAVAAALFAASLFIWFLSASLTSSWTCDYPPLHTRFVIGRTYTEDTIQGQIKNTELETGKKIDRQQAIEQLSRSRCEDLLEGALPHDPKTVWRPDEIEQRRRILSILYVLGTPLFAGCMIAALQAWYCADRQWRVQSPQAEPDQAPPSA